MIDGPVSIQRIVGQIASLDDQERDALQLLGQSPNVSEQVCALLKRIRKDRGHLMAVLRHSVASGRAGVRWIELIA